MAFLGSVQYILERDVPIDLPDELAATLIRQGTACMASTEEAERMRAKAEDTPAPDDPAED